MQFFCKYEAILYIDFDWQSLNFTTVSLYPFYYIFWNSLAMFLQILPTLFFTFLIAMYFNIHFLWMNVTCRFRSSESSHDLSLNWADIWIQFMCICYSCEIHINSRKHWKYQFWPKNPRKIWFFCCWKFSVNLAYNFDSVEFHSLKSHEVKGIFLNTRLLKQVDDFEWL